MLGSRFDGSTDLHGGQGRITQIFPPERIGSILLEAIGDLTIAVLCRKRRFSNKIPKVGGGRFRTCRPDWRSECEGPYGLAETKERDQNEYGHRLYEEHVDRCWV